MNPDERRKTLKKAARRTRLRKWSIRFGVVLLLVGLAIGGGVGAALFTVYKKLPDVGMLEDYTLPMATEIYTEDRVLLTRISGQGRYDPIALQELPQHVQDAVISAEDGRFWKHEGVDYLGLARAVYINVSKGKALTGASTITQQLIKNLFLTPEMTMKRKVAEALLAFQLENRYSKQQILEMYLNLVHLGHNVYGVEAASQIYFGKSARQLTLAESALMAGVIRSPAYLSPYNNPDQSNRIKELVLKEMLKDGRITEAQLDEALKEKIRLVGLRRSYPYPYFLDYVMYRLRQDYGQIPFQQGGWKVYTTLDTQLQSYGEKLLKQEQSRLAASGAKQAALVAVDPRSGYIRTMVGGVNYAESQFNRAFQAQRQVGSTFKPFVYLTAFEQGKTLYDTVKDEPTSFGGYRPQNYDRRFRGNVSLLQALTFSMNVPTVKLAHMEGIYRVIQTAQKAGVTSPIAADLTSALGSSEMNLLELTGAYATFANDGVLVRPTPILKIVDHTGAVIYDHARSQERSFSTGVVRQLTQALQNVVAAGTGTRARIGRPAAGKTGTTDQAYDTWFVGYIPQLATGVWAGNDNPSATRGGGGTTCAPIWQKFMAYATRRMPVQDFPGAEIPASKATADPSATPEPTASPENTIVEITPSPSQAEAIFESGNEPVAEVTPVRTATPVRTPLPIKTAAPSRAPASVRPSRTPETVPQQVPEENTVLEMKLPDM